MSERTLRFTVDNLLLSELGERLVTKNYIALAELIKNSYDADATSVTVAFVEADKRHSREGKGEIRIVDNGHGMTFQQIEEYWMRIATPNKLRHPISPKFGRKKTGDKGIGRFACRRLARKLVLESVAKKNETEKLEHSKMEFDWQKFEPGLTLTDIPNKCSTKLIPKGNTGLTLRLLGLNDVWTQRDFDVLRRQVLGLSVVSGIRREGFEEDPGFEIILQAPGFKMGKGRVGEQLMDAGWGRLRGHVSGNGTAALKLEAMKIGIVKFELPDSYPEIANIQFDVAVIWQRKEHIRGPSTLTLSLVSEIFEELSGVKVYLDGFRIYPYGDPGNDWLEIDKDVARRFRSASPTFRRISQDLLGVDPNTALLNHPQNRNLVGRVYVSNSPKKLFDVTLNREGFVENEAFESLKKFIRQGLEWTTIHYSHFRYRETEEKVQETISEFEELIEEYPAPEREVGRRPPSRKRPRRAVAVPVLESALDVLEMASEEDVAELSKESRKELDRRTKGAVRVVEETVSYMERQLTMLRTIASSGALMLTFMHEARDVASSLDTHATELEFLAEKLDDSTRKELTKLARAMRRTRDRLDSQIRLFGTVSKGLSVSNRRRLPLKDVFDEIRSCFGGLEKDYNFSIETEVPKSLRTGPMIEAELYSILINLVSNAVKAVIASDEGNRILVKATRKKEETNVRIYDDGIGLSKESRDLAFQALVVDPEGILYKRLRDKIKYKDLLIVGEGSGIGLPIVKDIVEFYGKGVQFVDTEKPWSTCIEVRLP